MFTSIDSHNVDHDTHYEYIIMSEKITNEERITQLETTVIQLLESNVNYLERIVALEATPIPSKRNYGPSSENAMNDEMAWRIRYGDLVGVTVKDIANDYGLSRGQIYSVRGMYTFTKVVAETFKFEENADEGTTKIVKQ